MLSDWHQLLLDDIPVDVAKPPHQLVAKDGHLLVLGHGSPLHDRELVLHALLIV